MSDDKDLIIHKLTEENSALAEALGQSTEARIKSNDRIAALENENADLRRQVESLQGCPRVLLTLTDRGDAGDGYFIDDAAYESGAQWVRELRAAG